MNSTLIIVSEKPTDLPIVTLKVGGRLDASTISQLEHALTDCFLSGGRAVVFDLSELTYVSSSGLRLLLSTRNTARKRGGDVFLCALHRNVREVFEMVGFIAVFSTYDSLEQGLEAASKAVGNGSDNAG